MSSQTPHPVHLGGYRLDSLLGSGDLGEIFRAWDERLERRVVLRRLTPEAPAEERARVRRGVRALGRANHAAIVQIYELLERDDGDGLVVESVDGPSLDQLIAGGGLELTTALRLGAELADGLAHAHDLGLAHGDLRPSNVRVSATVGGAIGRPKMLDFGLARLVSGEPADPRQDLRDLGKLLSAMLGGREDGGREDGTGAGDLPRHPPELPPELVQRVDQLLMSGEPSARRVAETLQGLRASYVPAGPAPSTRPGTRSATDPVPADSDIADIADIADLPTGELQLPSSDRADDGAVETAVRTLLLTDLVDSTGLVEALGDLQASQLLARHDRMARDLLTRHGGLEIDKSDGFLCLFERPRAAVAFALAYHRGLAELATATELATLAELRARVGLHLGEVVLRHNPSSDVSRGAKPLEVEGLAKPMAARLMGLAGARQTLLSRSVFELTRHADAGERWPDELRWLAHGDYLLQGVEAPVAVFEVGAADFAPLAAPADSAKARRVVSLAEEAVLGWRPAPGQAVPQRDRWRLVERLGEGGFGEVWLATHPSGEQRVFKFCFEAARLRALKREVTLFRVLKEALGHRDDIARVLDWNFESAPYFLEVEHTAGGDLASWAARHGGLASLPLATRLELTAQVADALAAAHSVGVLHKDIKPENVLVAGDGDPPRARLTDFGVGGFDREVRASLESRGVAVGGASRSASGGDTGFTQTLEEDATTAGSRRYLAPEVLEGKAASMPADLYSLGVLLYQMVVGDFSRALAPGWRREIDDELLVEDIALLVDGEPTRRPLSAGVIAERLRGLGARRVELGRRRRRERRGRRLRLAATVGGVLVAVLAILLVQAERARRDAERLQGRAERARQQAEGLIGFMLGDLQKKLKAIGRLDALAGAGEEALAYFEALDAEDLGTDTLLRQAEALHQMGDIRMAQGEPTAAFELFERAMRSHELAVAQRPDDLDVRFGLATSHYWLGHALGKGGRNAEALPAMQAYLEHCQELMRRQPDNPTWWLEVSYGHNAVGDMLLFLDDAARAREQFRSAMTFSQRLVERDDATSSWRSRHGTAQLKLARLSYEQGALADAAESIVGAITMYELLAEDGAARSRRRLAMAHEWATRIHLDLGGLSEAAGHSQQAVAIFSALSEHDPSHLEWRELLAFARARQGHVLDLAGERAPAREQLAAAIELLRDPAEPEDATVARTYLGASRTFLAQVLLRAGEPRAAYGQAEQAVALLAPLAAEAGASQTTRRRLALARLALAHAERQSGRPQAARAACARASQQLAPLLDSGHPRTLLYLAEAYRGLGRDDAARSLVYRLLGMGFGHPQLAACCGELVPS